MKTLAQVASLCCSFLLWLGCSTEGRGEEFSAASLPVTNLLQLARLLNTNEQFVRDVQMEATVCAASDPSIGVVILQDATDTELFEFSGGTPQLSPGDKIRIDKTGCFLRRREMGVQISVPPIVDNNGIHPHSTTSANMILKKGRHSLTVEWFNRAHSPSLELKWQIPALKFEDIPITNLYCSGFDEETGRTAIRPGLLAECFEGGWERVPNFDLLTPIKAVVVTNTNLEAVRTRDEFVGVRYQGFFDAPVDGVYRFATRSADGSLLFIDNISVPITKLGKDTIPKPVSAVINELLPKATKRPWVTLEGRVGNVFQVGRGAELELFLERNAMLVRIADTEGLDITNLLDSDIRITGVGCGQFDVRGGRILGQVDIANTNGVEIIRVPRPHKSGASPLTKAEQVQTLTIGEAKQQVPIRLRGVVTSKGRPVDFWLSIQDDTRGVFVKTHNASYSAPICGDFYEIVGHSGIGDFAPVVVADRLVRLGEGRLPDPIHPTWEELNNGSVDVQWVEFKGLVTGANSNVLSMLLPAGNIDVQVEEPRPSSLQSFTNAIVRIRGVLFADWNTNREVRIGSVLMRNADITVETPPPLDPFDAVLKTPAELLLFDPQATPFRRVKIRGQIVYTDSTQSFLEENGVGIRLLPVTKVSFQPGDLVEAVGYPNISKSALLLREAIIRKTGTAKLPEPRSLSKTFSNLDGLDGTRAQIVGQLLGWHFEQGKQVLEMQSGSHLFLARLAQADQRPLRVGSELVLRGVYVNLAVNRDVGRNPESFQLLLNSPLDIVIISQPSWWTLGRLLTLVGILLTILVFSTVWITQLRRQVEQRTAQLRKEIHERQRVEQQRVLEVERARIASDLHDDLGASLTEIAVLSSKGQRSGSVDQGIMSLFHAITERARELVSALDIIVWAVDPKDNSLQSVADYLCDFTDEFLSASGISCRYDVPVALPSVKLDGRLRHNLFLAVKETLNNIVRHSRATEVEFRIACENGRLQIGISDNGTGFDVMSPHHCGKGLKNVPLRISQIGGSCDLKSAIGKGTIVDIEIQLPLEENANAVSELPYDK